MIVLGHITAPFGVRGWIKVRPYTEARKNLLDYPVWWLGRGDDWRESKVVEGGVHGKSLIARLEGCADRNTVEHLRGLKIAVPRSHLPGIGENEYYLADLIGLEVLNLEGEALGKIVGLVTTGANDALRVKGQRERLIPFIKQVIVEVSLTSGMLRVDWGADY